MLISCLLYNHVDGIVGILKTHDSKSLSIDFAGSKCRILTLAEYREEVMIDCLANQESRRKELIHALCRTEGMIQKLASILVQHLESTTGIAAYHDYAVTATDRIMVDLQRTWPI